MADSKTSKKSKANRKPKTTVKQIEDSLSRFGFIPWAKSNPHGEGRVYDICEDNGAGYPDFERVVATGLVANAIPTFLSGYEACFKRVQSLESE